MQVVVVEPEMVHEPQVELVEVVLVDNLEMAKVQMVLQIPVEVEADLE
jgi:hypothetical protein